MDTERRESFSDFFFGLSFFLYLMTRTNVRHARTNVRHLIICSFWKATQSWGVGFCRAFAAMPAVSFQVSKSFLVSLAHVLRNILPTTSTRETRDRWDNLQECLRMASTVAAEVEDKEALSRLALLTFIAWETDAEGQVPDCLDVQDDQVLLRCHVCEHNITDLPRLQACRELHLDELDTAERDLAQLVSHCL